MPANCLRARFPRRFGPQSPVCPRNACRVLLLYVSQMQLSRGLRSGYVPPQRSIGMALVPDATQRVSGAAQSRDPEAARSTAHGPGPAAHRRRGCAPSGQESPNFGIATASDARFRILAASAARAVRYTLPPKMPRAQGRPGAGWHPRSTVRRLRYKRLHSGIQVKPNTRPSLRSGFTAYVALSPGSDALLPPSPCGWLMLRTR
jgi:hypothetical protein